MSGVAAWAASRVPWLVLEPFPAPLSLLAIYRHRWRSSTLRATGRQGSGAQPALPPAEGTRPGRAPRHQLWADFTPSVRLSAGSSPAGQFPRPYCKQLPQPPSARPLWPPSGSLPSAGWWHRGCCGCWWHCGVPKTWVSACPSAAPGAGSDALHPPRAGHRSPKTGRAPFPGRVRVGQSVTPAPPKG